MQSDTHNWMPEYKTKAALTPQMESWTSVHLQQGSQGDSLHYLGTTSSDIFYKNNEGVVALLTIHVPLLSY